jgi:hypothetical protein
VTGFAAVPIFVIEVISNFVRMISLSVRLFANILAGHLMILFMGGGLVVLLGIAALGVVTLPMAIAFFIFEVGLIATLQAFIFATLTSIYLGGAVAERPLRRSTMDLGVLLTHRPGGDHRRPARRRQGDRARRRRRARRDRRRHRHRHHLRQGHRVGHPPARDARRDHVDPVARLRAHRGVASSTAFIFGLIAFFL